jgi:hypothetical protein
VGVTYLELCSVVAQYPARNTLDRPRTFGGDELTNRSQLLTYGIDWVSGFCIRPDPPAGAGDHGWRRTNSCIQHIAGEDGVACAIIIGGWMQVGANLFAGSRVCVAAYRHGSLV